MTIERKSPIPVGRYWVDAIDDTAVLFADAWLNRHSKTVKQLKREETPGTGPFAPSWAPRRVWYLFDVLQPTDRWQAVKGLGLPNIVRSQTAPNAPVVTTSADTATRPPPSTLSDFLPNFDSGDLKTLALVALGLYWLTKGR